MTSFNFHTSFVLVYRAKKMYCVIVLLVEDDYSDKSVSQRPIIHHTMQIFEVFAFSHHFYDQKNGVSSFPVFYNQGK